MLSAMVPEVALVGMVTSTMFAQFARVLVGRTYLRLKILKINGTSILDHITRFNSSYTV